MSWQEELRKLDEELAAGQISADDYRVRRDQVLSSAVSAGPEGKVGQANATEKTQFVARPQPPQPPQPPTPPQSPATPAGAAVQPPDLPPPPGPKQANSSGDDAERTQVVSTGDADRTQTVGPWQTARPGDPDRTQVVPGVPPQAYAGGMPPRPAPGPGAFPPPPGYGWQQQPDEYGSPWGGSEFPPLAQAGNPDWVRQGPEVFDAPSGRGRRVLIILLIVLVLGGAGAAVYFLAIKGSNGNQPVAQTSAGPPPTTSKPTSTTPPKPVDPFEDILQKMPTPPAHGQQDSRVLALSELVPGHLMDQAEVDLLTAAGVTKVPWRSGTRVSGTDGPTPDVLTAMVIHTASPEAARKLVNDLKAYQDAHGLLYIAEPLPNMPPSVVFEKQVTAARVLYRGLWVSGSNVIRMTTVQTPMTDEAALSGSYRNHTEEMLRVFPAE